MQNHSKAKPTGHSSPTVNVQYSPLSRCMALICLGSNMQKLHSFIQEQVLKHDVDLLSLLDWIKVKRIDSC